MPTDQQTVPISFGPEHAEKYDGNFTALAPVKDVMHLILQAHLSGLPDNARILVAGAGTGAEVRFLAALHPSWHFTLADPSPAMLDVARKHADTEAFADRCVFHSDYVSTLDADNFDAGTSLLVSHFLNDTETRTAYYQSVCHRLKLGAPLLNVDLCADTDARGFLTLMALWKSMLALNGVNEAAQAQYASAYGRDFACHGPAEVEVMIEAAGFDRPVQCFQAALMRGWITSRQR